jgi:ferredoxin-nitrate reductase
MHWGALHAPAGSGWANTTTSPAKDPTSSQPELKAAAVRVEPVADPPDRGRLSSTEAGLTRTRGRSPRRRRLVVVGTGMSGLRVVEEVLERSPTGFAITMLGEEPGRTYNRIMLSKLLARTAGPEDAELQPASWYSSRDVDLRGGSPAKLVDLEQRRVIGADGEVHGFDALVLATGSRPFVPPIPGADRPHVYSFRTAEDARAIATAADRSEHALVLGGGLLGLEAAAGLLAHDVEVSVVEVADRLMPQQLDHGGARTLQRALTELGVSAMVGRRVEEIADGEVVLDGGEAVPADLVVVAAGVRPETSLAAEAGIAVGRGILVDDELRTDAPGVWAVGECAEHRGTVYGLWAPLAEQAQAAGASLVGDPGGFAGAATATTLKIAGIDLFTGGPAGADGEQDELLYHDSRSGVYRKLVVEGSRLVGAMVVGDARSSRRLTELLRTGADVPLGVLAPEAAGENGAEEPPDDEAILCSCNRKTRGEVLGAIRGEGLATLAEVAAATSASTGCGSCAGEVEELLAGHSSGRNTQVNGQKPEPATIE